MHVDADSNKKGAIDMAPFVHPDTAATAAAG
jgi:hypothetical protein